MARQEHVLSVFVASPGDVGAERAKLEEVIRELNVTWSRELSVRLDLVRWETHAFPSVAADAQDVINEQIPDDSDLFVGIMWCQYGTPTGRVGSGTVEEFNRAKARYDSDPNSIQLMVYFKDEPVPPSKLDPTQLAMINEFRRSLGQGGVLYWSFSGMEQFEKLVRLHLTRQIQAWKSRVKGLPSAGLTSKEGSSGPTQEDDDRDDDGLLDLVETFEERFAELTEISQRIADATEQLGAKMHERTAEISALRDTATGSADVREAKRFISRAASDMRQFTARIEGELPLFSDSMNSGMNAFIRATALYGTVEVDQQQVKGALDAIVNVRGNLGDAKTQVGGFRETIAGLPRMTTELNKAKRGVTTVLDQLLAEFEKGEVLIGEAEKVITESRRHSAQ